jgi:hypothetical protein
MATLFLICAAVGGTVMVVQFLMTLIGLGGHAFDIDVPEAGHGHLDFGTDVHDVHDFQGHVDAGAAHSHGTQVFRVLSLRTVTAALAFFGLGGLGGRSVGWGTWPTIALAAACGFGALYAVFWLMQSLRRFNADGTARIGHAIGRHGTVYTTIPEHQSGVGKIQLSVQNRTMEYLAQTQGAKIPPGAKIVVTGIVTPDTVVVEPVFEEQGVNHV